jgi:hypothetical protein
LKECLQDGNFEQGEVSLLEARLIQHQKFFVEKGAARMRTPRRSRRGEKLAHANERRDLSRNGSDAETRWRIPFLCVLIVGRTVSHSAVVESHAASLKQRALFQSAVSAQEAANSNSKSRADPFLFYGDYSTDFTRWRDPDFGLVDDGGGFGLRHG